MIRHAAAGCMLLLAAACSNAGRGQDAYARGVAALAEGQPRTARVEFLNAIAADPENSAARVMQARAYLALSDGAAARAEIERARTLGASPADTRHLLAHALLLDGEPARAIEALEGSAPAHAAYADRVRAQALHALGDEPGASAAFDRALAAAPGDAQTWTALGRFRRDRGDLAGAVAATDKALKLKPAAVDTIVLRGELTRGQYGLRAALPWFDRAIEADPAHVTALLERAATLGDLGRMSAMLADTRKVLALSKAHPRAFYLQATLAARAGKYELARALYARTGEAFADQPAAMLLAGAIDLQTGRSELAVRQLRRLVALQPDNRKARRLLAAAHWRRSDAAATIETLRPIADLPDADSYTSALMGRALAQVGRKDAAAVYLARAAQPQRRLATALLSRPVGADQLAALRQAAAADAANPAAQVTLIGALLSSGLGDEALRRALRLQATNPGVPDAHVLAGDARGLGGDFAGAAEDYRKAANLAFNEPVAMRLIEALRRSGKPAAAADVLALFLQQNPRNVSAQLLAAAGHMEAGRWNEAIDLYEDLRLRLGDRDAVLLNNLAWAYAQGEDFAMALPLARKAWSLDPDNPATADTYGWLLYKSGRDKARGLVLLGRAARGAPSDADIRKHLEVARGG